LTTIPATPPAIAPVAPAAIPQEQTVPTTASGIVTTEEMSATANPDSLAAAEPTVVTWKIIPAPTAIAQAVPDATLQEETSSTDASMEQLTSVTQLADVQPTDWAFQALQLLVERYGCIVGYPDRTYRGNRTLTRYEFAAGLNACLDQVNKLIATATADLVKREDLETLQRLQAEFSVELSSLRGRVDALEATTAELEANRFSTTTKLTGQVVWAVSGGGFSGDQLVDPRDPINCQ
jgi:hypothetical protein